MRRRNSKSRDSLFNLLQYPRRRNLTTLQELSRNGKRRSEHSLGDGETIILLGKRGERGEPEADGGTNWIQLGRHVTQS